MACPSRSTRRPRVDLGVVLCYSLITAGGTPQEAQAMNTDDNHLDDNHLDASNRDTGSTESTESEFIAYTGHDVIDDRGERIGQITDVIYDDPTTDVIGDPLVSPKPRWLVVDPGLLRAAHYVPVDGSYRSVDGDIVVPWDKEWIKSAPKARGDHLLSTLDLQDLALHYATV